MTIGFSTFGFKISLFHWTVFSTYQSMFFPTSFKLFATKNLVTTISNSLLTAGHFLDLSGVVVFFVSCCIPFGWKSSTYIYHSTGLVASHYLRSLGIPSFSYIDDRHSSQLSFLNGCLPVAYQNLPSQDSIYLALANAAIFVTCFILSSLGYVIGLEKSTLVPCKQVPYLGFVSDSEKQAFILLPHKKEKFLILLKQALSPETIDLVTLQRLGGKCISMALAVPGARLYTNEINLALARAVRSSRPVKLSGPLRQELEHWLFLETWNGFLPWRSGKTLPFSIVLGFFLLCLGEVY